MFPLNGNHFPIISFLFRHFFFIFLLFSYFFRSFFFLRFPNTLFYLSLIFPFLENLVTFISGSWLFNHDANFNFPITCYLLLIIEEVPGFQDSFLWVQIFEYSFEDTGLQRYQPPFHEKLLQIFTWKRQKKEPTIFWRVEFALGFWLTSGHRRSREKQTWEGWKNIKNKENITTNPSQKYIDFIHGIFCVQTFWRLSNRGVYLNTVNISLHKPTRTTGPDLVLDHAWSWHIMSWMSANICATAEKYAQSMNDITWLVSKDRHVDNAKKHPQYKYGFVNPDVARCVAKGSFHFMDHHVWNC